MKGQVKMVLITKQNKIHNVIFDVGKGPFKITSEARKRTENSLKAASVGRNKWGSHAQQ